MVCLNGHNVESSDSFCQECGARVISPAGTAAEAAKVFGLDRENAATAAGVFGLACAKGHPLPEGMTTCPRCNATAPDFIHGTPATGRPKWLLPTVAGVVAAMIIGVVAVLVMPSPVNGLPMKFHYAYPGLACSQTGAVHDGTEVEVTTNGGKLLATGQLQGGVLKQIGSGQGCVYTLSVRVPRDVGTYFFRAMGDKTVYRVYRNTIDTSSNGWLSLSTVTVGVATVIWTGSLYAQ